jgi:DNA repair protein RecO (recombination protein O)
MILSTRGIVLHCMDYSETSIIARVYTEQLGLQSYIVKGARKKGAGIRKNLFAPLSLLQLVATHKEGEGLRILREASCIHQLNGIATDMARMSVSIYVSELLSRTLSTQMADPELFRFLEQQTLELDTTSGSVAAFPLMFTLGFTRFMGFDPHNNFSEADCYFDMMGGNFCPLPPAHPHYLAMPLSHELSRMLHCAETGEMPPALSHSVRMDLLKALLDYYRVHIPAFGEMRSVQVLSDVLKEGEG